MVRCIDLLVSHGGFPVCAGRWSRRYRYRSKQQASGGSSNTAVTCAVSSPSGAIAGTLTINGSNSAIYSAPATVAGNQTIVITATSQADNVTQGAAQVMRRTGAIGGTMTSTNLTDFQACIGPSGTAQTCALFPGRYTIYSLPDGYGVGLDGVDANTSNGGNYIGFINNSCMSGNILNGTEADTTPVGWTTLSPPASRPVPGSYSIYRGGSCPVPGWTSQIPAHSHIPGWSW
jgi:hypothetical protein